MILLVVLAGFSLSFYVLYKAGTGVIDLPSVVVDDATEYTVQDEVYGYDTWYSSFLPGFALMLGAYQLGEPTKHAFLFLTFLQMWRDFFVSLISLSQ